MEKKTYQIVLTTCPDNDCAQRIAQSLVREHLAACVNIVPTVNSVYLWKGQIQNDNEHLLLIKSSARRYKAIERRIRDLHPYELPEIIAVPIISGLNDYLSWLNHPA